MGEIITPEVYCSHTEMRATESLVEHPRNYNTHPKEQVNLLAKIIRHQGWRNPITVSKRSGYIVKGHARLAAAKLLELEKVPVDVQEYADEASEYADMIADNRIAELAEADQDALKTLLTDNVFDGFDIELTGFTGDEVNLDFGSDEDVKDDSESAEALVDDGDVLQQKWGTKLGQIWELGDHRLLCGDSTKKEDVERVMGGEGAGGIVTDPPYGIGIDGQKQSVCKNPKHNRKAHAFMGWDSERPAKSVFDFLLNMDCPSVIFGGNYFADMLPASRGWIYWSKGQDGLSMSDGELAWTTTSKPLRCVTVNRGALRGSAHPTQKPVEVIAFAINYIEPKDGPIYDPFCGSGTTIIACEQLNRKCYAMEISPKYVAVALQRWADFTGKEPVLLETI